MRITFLRRYAVAASAAVALLLAACQKSDADAGKIEASNYQGWHSVATEHLTPAQGTALESALQALKLQAMTQSATGAEAIDQAVYQKVNGKTVNEVIQLGYGAKLAQLQEQRDQIDAFLSQNAQLTTKQGDTASADYLAHRRDEQAAQRDGIDRQIAAIKDELKGLGIAVPAVAAPASHDHAAGSTIQPGASDPAGMNATPAASAQESPDSAPVPIHK